MSEETSGSFTSRLFRKASANLAPAVTVQVADSPLSTRNSSSSPLAVERAPSFGNVVQSAVCEGDDPADLAALFCKIHSLKSARVLKKIESHITDNLANLPTTPTAAPGAAPAEAK